MIGTTSKSILAPNLQQRVPISSRIRAILSCFHFKLPLLVISDFQFAMPEKPLRRFQLN